MSAPVWIGVALLGGVGAVVRVGAGAAVAHRAGSVWAGTLAVNLLGAFALGLLAGVQLGDTATRLLGLGLLGALTTFSTWMVEAERDRTLTQRTMLIAGPLLLGLLAVWAGRSLAGAL